MKYKEKEIKEGIKVHFIKNDRFKTNLIAVFLSLPLERENVTKNALIPAILRRGSKNMQTQEDMSKNLEEMYGAIFDCGVEKKGDNQILKFYLETVNDEFLPEHTESLLKESIDKILEIIFNPYIEENSFKEEYINQEKTNLKQIIEGKSDNKARYALERCIEEMYKGENYGLYKYGYIEDLEKITKENIYKYYQEMIQKCKIDIYVSGITNEQILEYIEKNENLAKLDSRKSPIILNKIDKKEEKKSPNTIFETSEVTQGKLIIGLDVLNKSEDEQYDVLLYNSILGGNANSKLFQNVREKASLAYTANSSYIKIKNTIYISSGIEIENYQKALEIIEKQIEEMKQGNFEKEDVENAKKGFISAINAIEDEQDAEIIYYFGQEFNNIKLSIEDYKKRIEKITKEDIVKIANLISINTIYFLQDGSISRNDTKINK